MNEILRKIIEDEQNLGSESSILPNRRQRPNQEGIIPEIDLLNIQGEWDLKIGRVFEMHGLPQRHFPISRSKTGSLPLKFYIDCPRCGLERYVTLTVELKPSGNYVKNYRTYTFTSHAIQCVKEAL